MSRFEPVIEKATATWLGRQDFEEVDGKEVVSPALVSVAHSATVNGVEPDIDNPERRDEHEQREDGAERARADRKGHLVLLPLGRRHAVVAPAEDGPDEQWHALHRDEADEEQRRAREDDERGERHADVEQEREEEATHAQLAVALLRGLADTDHVLVRDDRRHTRLPGAPLPRYSEVHAAGRRRASHDFRAARHAEHGAARRAARSGGAREWAG